MSCQQSQRSRLLMQHCCAGPLMASPKPLCRLCLGRPQAPRRAPRAHGRLGARPWRASSPPSHSIKAAQAHARPEWPMAHALCWHCHWGRAAPLSTALELGTSCRHRQLQGYSPPSWQIASSTTCAASKQHGGPALGCAVSAILDHMHWQPATLSLVAYGKVPSIRKSLPPQEEVRSSQKGVR